MLGARWEDMLIRSVSTSKSLTTLADWNPPPPPPVHTDSPDLTQAQAHLIHSQIFAKSLCFTPFSGHEDRKQESQVKTFNSGWGAG